MSGLIPGMAAAPVWAQMFVFMGVAPLVMLMRYLAVAGSAYVLGVFTERRAPWRRIQPQPFTLRQLRREIGYSALTSLVFAAILAGVHLATQLGWTQIYVEPDPFASLWFWLQIPFVLAVQDFYFYWMHRAVHRPTIYKRVHNVHHLSTNPSSFSAFAFHPLEAVLELGFIVPLAFVVPLTFPALALTSLLSLIYNAYGHMGYEVMPRWMVRSGAGRWFNTASTHNQHHKTYRYNYGLYTTVWDRLFGTLHPDADAQLVRVTGGPAKGITHT